MTARLSFLAIVLFWLTMNGLLWRTEFLQHGNDIEVPVALVWRKILTAPDASSLSVYHNGERMGYCEFSTSVGQQMATIDADNLPPDNITKKAGYQIHLAGNVSFGDFTNRVKFDGNIKFSNPRAWSELKLKITLHQMVVLLHADATDRILHLKINSDGAVLERDLALDQLNSSGAILQTLLGDAAEPFRDALDLPDLPGTIGDPMPWSAYRTRVKIGTEPVPIYHVESSLLGHDVSVDVSTLGEVLRVQLPGKISARIDEWTRH